MTQRTLYNIEKGFEFIFSQLDENDYRYSVWNKNKETGEWHKISETYLTDSTAQDALIPALLKVGFIEI